MAETSQLHLFWICTEWKDDSIFRRWLLNRLQIRWSRFLSRHGVSLCAPNWPVEFPGNFANQALMRRLTRPALLACCRCSQEFPFAWGWSVFQWVFWQPGCQRVLVPAVRHQCSGRVRWGIFDSCENGMVSAWTTMNEEKSWHYPWRLHLFVGTFEASLTEVSLAGLGVARVTGWIVLVLVSPCPRIPWEFW